MSSVEQVKFLLDCIGYSELLSDSEQREKFGWLEIEVQNKTEQMEYHDNAITALTLKADMIEGYFHELLVPYVIKSLKRNLDQMTDQDRSVTGRLINDIEKKLSED